MHLIRRLAGWGRVLWQVLRPMTTLLVLLHAALAWALFTTPGGLADAAAGSTPVPVPELGRVLAALGTVAAWYAHAVAVNDLSDVEVDRINLTTEEQRRGRPLVNSSASPRRLWWLVAALSVVQLGLAWLVAGWLVPVAAVMVVLNGVYSLPPCRLSARGAVAQVCLPLGYVVHPSVVALALATGDDGVAPPGGVVVPGLVMAGLAVLFCGRLFGKDIRDEVGDRATGKRTFLVRHGLLVTLRVCGVVVLAGVLLSGTALSVWLARPSPALGVAAAACAVAVPWGLRSLWRAAGLDRRLLWTGFVGRVATGWLFCCLLLVIARTQRMADWQAELLAGLGLVVFGFGCLRFLEELSVAVDGPTSPADQGPHAGGGEGDQRGDGQVVGPARAEQLGDRGDHGDR